MTQSVVDSLRHIWEQWKNMSPAVEKAVVIQQIKRNAVVQNIVRSHSMHRIHVLFVSFFPPFFLCFSFKYTMQSIQFSFLTAFHSIEKYNIRKYSHFDFSDIRSSLNLHHPKKKKFSLPILHNCKLHTLMSRICS
jgi:hypothetical protein